MRVLPRQDGTGFEEMITHICTYSLHTSCDGKEYTAVASGEWPRTAEEKSASFPAIRARFVKLVSGPEWLPDFFWGFSPKASAAEIDVDIVVNSF